MNPYNSGPGYQPYEDGEHLEPDMFDNWLEDMHVASAPGEGLAPRILPPTAELIQVDIDWRRELVNSGRAGRLGWLAMGGRNPLAPTLTRQDHFHDPIGHGIRDRIAMKLNPSAVGIMRKIDLAKVYRAEGHAGSMSHEQAQKAPSVVPQVTAAELVAKALTELSESRVPRSQFREIARGMILEVGDIRRPGLQRSHDTEQALYNRRPPAEWGELSRAANIKLLVDAAFKQLGGEQDSTRAWKELKTTGITGIEFGHLIEHYFGGMDAYNWEMQVTGGAASLPPVIVERLDFVVRLEAEMHLHPTERNTVLDLIDNPTLPDKPEVLTRIRDYQRNFNNEVAARIEDYLRNFKNGSYFYPQTEHPYRQPTLTYIARRQADLHQYINRLRLGTTRVRNDRERWFLRERAEAELRNIDQFLVDYQARAAAAARRAAGRRRRTP